MEYENVKIVSLNGIDYIVTDEINIDNTRYVYLTNENDFLDFCVRKIVVINGEEYLEKLDNDDEFDKALKVYYDKNAQVLEDFN